MPIISTIGRRSFKSRFLVLSIYVALILGATTMVYPFLLMIAGSTKSGVDLREQNIIPTFLKDDVALYRKHIEALFNERLDPFKYTYQLDAPSFEKIQPPREDQINKAFVELWESFIRDRQDQLGPNTYDIGHLTWGVSRQSLPLALRQFKAQLTERYDNDLDKLNQECGLRYTQWRQVRMSPAEMLLRHRSEGRQPLDLLFNEFKEQQPQHNRTYYTVEGFYRVLFLYSQYTRDIEQYNIEHGTSYTSYKQVLLPRRIAGNEKQRKDWEEFVREIINLIWVRIDNTATAEYRRFLRAKHVSIDTLNEHHQTDYRSFDVVPLPDKLPPGGIPASDWTAFVAGWRDPVSGDMIKAPLTSLYLDTVDFRFRDYLAEQFGTAAAMNEAIGTDFASFDKVYMPQYEAHYLAFKDITSPLRGEFIKRNYVSVFDFIVLKGRGMFNTVVYCTLAILAALLVNPLAAYAMSRYRMPSSYKILLFLMMTMAFPAMVTSIPSFLMMREFGMLNTFAALILPGLAQGYSIFLLKGFFDSLPRELYECADLDGANEWVMFWQITMTLSKPILAVIALGAFTAAYSNFLFALLVVQDERMWTLMVWVYQLQSSSGPGVIFASLIIVAIPTFLVFAFCQNIIMRGIVVPVEK